MRRFKLPGQAQPFLSAHNEINNLFQRWCRNWDRIGIRGRYRVACQAMDLTSFNLADGADVLTTVKDKARCRARACGPP